MSEDENKTAKAAEHVCAFCEKPCPSHLNFCRAGFHDEYGNEDCIIKQARADGAVDHRPNGLPIKCISYQHEAPVLLECEHGDHLDYICPVEVEFIGPVDDDCRADYEACTGVVSSNEDEVRRMNGETHALIYTDGTVAVTLHECCYAMWNVRTGRPMGHLWYKNPYENSWQLSAKAIETIKARAASRTTFAVLEKK